MTIADLLTLFHPGSGRIPPYLAGRDVERARFDAVVRNLSNGIAADGDMIVYGPRGNGKTAMLRHFANNCVYDGTRPSILWMTPDDMQSLEDMTRVMADQDKGFPDRFSPVAASLDPGIARLSTEVAVGRRSSFFREILASLCARNPVVLIVDEAHNLDPGIAGDLLNASQEIRANPDTPFFLVLAGTPGLVPLLQQSSASFWERGDIVELGRLSPEAAADALALPLADAGVSIDREIAAEVADRAHCYPYFIQVWGDEMASCLHDSKESAVSADTVARIEDRVNDRISTIYSVRLKELDKMGLLDVSVQVARHFLENGRDRVSHIGMMTIIRQAHVGLGMDARDSVVSETAIRLASIGFIWKTKSSWYEPGIPSLMNHVVNESLKADLDEDLTGKPSSRPRGPSPKR